MLPVEAIRKDFPILGPLTDPAGGHNPPAESRQGSRLIYLDNAATTQLPLCVLDRLRQHYCTDNANVHRGLYALSERSTAAFEAARETVRAFLNAESPEEIVFAQGTTDAIHIAASGLRGKLRPGDTVVVTALEHHSNFLPWQRLCAETGAAFTVIPCPQGEPDMLAYAEALRASPKIVALAQVSNLTGTVLPLREMIAPAHAAGALVLVDGAQGARHEPADVRTLDCDFYCFSGHKILAPTGIGVLYGKREHLERLEPTRLGGGMVDTVTATGFTCGPLPTRLEAGTPNYAGAIALGEALRYIDRLGRSAVADYERGLIAHAEQALSAIEGVRILGRPRQRAGCLSFLVDGVHPYDAASVLDKMGVALRSGTHCAQPALAELGVSAAIRLSPAFYNTTEEIDAACQAIVKMRELFAKWTKQ